MTRRKRSPGLTPHTIYTKPSHWEYAKQQPGGASRYIDTLLSTMRRRDITRAQTREIRRLLTEKARLEGIIVKMGGEF